MSNCDKCKKLFTTHNPQIREDISSPKGFCFYCRHGCFVCDMQIYKDHQPDLNGDICENCQSKGERRREMYKYVVFCTDPYFTSFFKELEEAVEYLELQLVTCEDINNSYTLYELGNLIDFKILDEKIKIVE